MASAQKELREIIRAAERQGWRAEKRSRHWKLYSPDGEAIVVAAATPGGGRWKANLIAELRRYGFEWKGR